MTQNQYLDPVNWADHLLFGKLGDVMRPGQGKGKHIFVARNPKDGQKLSLKRVKFEAQQSSNQSRHLDNTPSPLFNTPNDTIMLPSIERSIPSSLPPSMASQKSELWLWFTNTRVVDDYIHHARLLIENKHPDVVRALAVMEMALAKSPKNEMAMEMKARCLLSLRKYKEVADMLKDYIPSYRAALDGVDDSLSSVGSGGSQRAMLLPGSEERPFQCFSLGDLKRRVMAGFRRSSGEKEGYWRYLVLGDACYHLGLLDDAVVLLAAGRRLATAIHRRDSISLTDDDFTTLTSTEKPPPPGTPESAALLLAHIKPLLRRRSSALAALDAGNPIDAARLFSKILDGNSHGYGTIPSSFALTCFLGRAAAHRAAGKPADALADSNRALSLEPASIPSLRARSDVLQSIRAFVDCVLDLDHLKLLYESILISGKLPGPAWRPHSDVRYRDIPGDLQAVKFRIQKLRAVMCAGGIGIDYYTLLRVSRGCNRFELERAHRLLSLRNKPDKAVAFLDRIEFPGEEREMIAVRDQAKTSGMMFFRMLQKGYSSIMAEVVADEAEERRRVIMRNTRYVAAAGISKESVVVMQEKPVFCRSDAVSERRLMLDVGFRGGIAVKYEALRC